MLFQNIFQSKFYLSRHTVHLTGQSRFTVSPPRGREQEITFKSLCCIENVGKFSADSTGSFCAAVHRRRPDRKCLYFDGGPGDSPVSDSPVAAEALHVVLTATLTRVDVTVLSAARGRARAGPGRERERGETGVSSCHPVSLLRLCTSTDLHSTSSDTNLPVSLLQDSGFGSVWVWVDPGGPWRIS